MLAETDLSMAGYSGDARARDAKANDRGYGRQFPASRPWACLMPYPLTVNGVGDSIVFTDNTPTCGHRMPQPMPLCFNMSPEYFRAAGTTLASGRGLHMAGRQKRAECRSGERGVRAQGLRLRGQRHRRAITR